MERDGSVLSTCFCVRLSPPDGTKSSHRREYSAQMRDGVIRPNRPDDAEPSRKNHRSHLTLALPPYFPFFSRASPSQRPAAALPPIALSLSGAALPPIALSLSGGLSGAALPRLGGGGGCCEARRGRRLLRGSAGAAAGSAGAATVARLGGAETVARLGGLSGGGDGLKARRASTTGGLGEVI
jgi:hypothetical protein